MRGDARDGSFVKERLMDKFLESGDNDLELQIVMIRQALERMTVKSSRNFNFRIDKKIWFNNVQKTFRTLADFELFIQKRKAIKILDIMVDNIKKEVKERKVKFLK